MKRIIFVLFLAFLVSCNEQQNIETKPEDKGSIDIIIDNVNSPFPNNNTLNSNIFTEEEIKEFRSKNIDIERLEKIYAKYEQGDPDAINSLSYAYYITKNEKKLRSVLETGLKYNVKEAIYNLSLLEIEKKNYDKALEYFDKLPNGYKTKEIEDIKAGIYIDKAEFFLAKNEYSQVLNNLLKSYKLGVKDLEYEIAKVYILKNDENNAIIWLKKAYENKNELAMIDLANIYSKRGNYKEAIELYEKLFNLGNLNFAINIYENYYKLLDNRSTIKWYEISRNLGLVERKEELEKLRELYK